MATRDQEHGLTLNVNAVCTNNNEQELLKLYFDNADIFADTSVLEIKLKLQDLLNAPVCIQQLSYLDQTLIDPETKLADLYVRQGETLYVKYLAKVDITRLNDCINMLRKFESLLSQLCTSDGRHVCVPSVNDVEKVEDLYADLFDPLETLSHIFGQWKTVPVQAVRRYFVQEKGLDYLMEINAFSKKEYTWFTQSMKENPPTLSINNDDGEEDNMADQDEQLFMRTDELVKTFNEWQYILNALILRVLWNFMETGPETKLVLQHGGLKLIIDAYLKTRQDDMYQDYVDEIHENALGCLCGCVEYDKSVQREVAANRDVLDKFVEVIGYDLDSSISSNTEQECCLVANTLFYLTFDQEALKLLIEYKLHLKIMNDTKHLFMMTLQEMEFSKPLVVCYYCLLFLARVRSSTLIAIPQDQAVAIDKCIRCFLKNGAKPQTIGMYEEQNVYVWMTLAPIVHMAFARGTTLSPCDNSQMNTNVDAKKMKLSTDESEEEDADGISFRENRATPTEDVYVCGIPEWDTESDVAVSNNDTNVQWPGSKWVQNIGIFALQHTLYSEDNVKLMISENLHSYLVCLLWQLEDSNRRCLESLLRSSCSLHVPRLSVICKSALARMSGFDEVRKL